MPKKVVEIRALAGIVQCKYEEYVGVQEAGS